MSVSINLPLNDVMQSVERPVIFQIIRSLQTITQISMNTQIRFYGNDAKAAQFNSTITKDEESDNLWPHRENITIEVEDDFDPDHMLSMSVKTPNTPCVFLDKDLDIGIRPVYTPTIVRISFSFKAADENAAKRWRNEIRSRYAMGREVMMHTVNYAYHVPEEYIYILKEIYRLRENVEGHGDTFEEWFKSNMTNKASLVCNMAGSQSIWMISEVQSGIQGVFDFEAVPEKPEREDEPNLWAVRFTYQFKYDKPINSMMIYPPVIHQQVLSLKYRDNPEDYSYQKVWKQYSQAQLGLSKFQVDEKDRASLSNCGLNIPPFDKFVPSWVPVATVRAATILSVITPADQRTLFNLSELGEFNIRTEILDFIRDSEWRYMCTPYASILQLHYYENHHIKEQSMITVDHDLNVKAVSNLNMRRVHRVRLSLVANLSFLTSEALQRLKDYPGVASLIANAINQAINSMGHQKDIRQNKIPVAQLKGLGLDYKRDEKTITDNNDGLIHNLRGNEGLTWGLVEYLFINANDTKKVKSTLSNV